jgi:hypothetical protein
VRRTVLVIAGALLLQLSLLSIAQAGPFDPNGESGGSYPTEPSKTDPPPTEPSKTEPSKTDPPPTEPSKTDPPPTEPSKTDPPPTKPTRTDPPPTDPTTTEPEPPEFGTMRISPRSGRAGTVISVKSVTPSPLDGEQFTLVGLFSLTSEEPVAVVALDVAADGSWAGSITVPRGTRPGDYLVAAEAVLANPEGEGPATQQEASFPYAAVPFEVLPAPIRPGVRPPATPTQPAPSAPPVVRAPSLTG